MKNSNAMQTSGSNSAATERRSNILRYTIEVLASATILLWGYHAASAHGAVWAIITAVLILQPGLNTSLRASGVRVIATLVGASVGTAVALPIGRNNTAVLLGLVVTILVCYLLRLDAHVRQACLTVPIVQMWPDNSLVRVDSQRIIAILVGCIVPLIVQFGDALIWYQVRRLIGSKKPDGVHQSHEGAK
jgi:Aromatic acid exporter family member 1